MPVLRNEMIVGLKVRVEGFDGAGTYIKGDEIISIRIFCKNLVSCCIRIINCSRNQSFQLQWELGDKGTKSICVYNIRACCKIIVVQLNYTVRVFYIPGFRKFTGF